MNGLLRWQVKLLPIIALTVFSQGVFSSSFAAPVPGGTLDPLSIPKYVTPLVIPPEMPKSTTQPGAPAADYNIAVRQFKQQILPGGIWNALGLTTATFGPTTVWSYGRAEDPAPDASNIPGVPAGVAPAPNTTFNYPAFTIENTSGALTKVRWINDLVEKDPTSPNFGKYLSHLFPIDQTLHWANPPAVGCTDGTNRPDCMTLRSGPYTGPVPIITHVHGAHVNPESDGFPEAWWLPAANNIPAGYAKRGSKFDQFDITNTVLGSAFFGYENSQAAATLWYHDHTLGMTRSNVYAGPAGFWLVRGLNDLPIGTLPGPRPGVANVAGDPNFDPAVRATIREIPIAIQDRSFNYDPLTGTTSLFYPDNRAFFEGLNVNSPFVPPQFLGAGVLNIPFVPASDIAPIWNPEAFFNTMVVNGTTWPKLDVAPAIYRLRLLNGCNSRFLNLALFTVNADGTLGTEIPFYQIGAEEGFLPNVVMLRTGFATVLPGGGIVPPETPTPTQEQALLMGNAERADVLVDFSALPNGTVIRMINTGPDSPFGGFPIDPLAVADSSTTGQVMQFVVNSALAGKSPTDPVLSDGITPNPNAATLPKNLVLPAEPQIALPATYTTRQVSLNEEESGQVCVQVYPVLDPLTGQPVLDPVTGLPVTTTLDPATGDMNAIAGVAFDPINPAVFLANCAAAGGVPFAPKAAKLGTMMPTATGLMPMPMMWMDKITENPILNSTEVWEIFNTTVDAHPIHIHMVAFNVIDRQTFDPLTFAPVAGTTTLPNPNEAGYKDTVVALPGQITRLKAKFDIPGEYVWHCHIVEHEDNEMMRPYVVRFDPNRPDLNNDGRVDRADLNILLAKITAQKVNPRPSNMVYDLNGDGALNVADARYLLIRFN